MLITTGGIIKYVCVIWTLNKNVVKLLPFFSLLFQTFHYSWIDFLLENMCHATIYEPFTNTMDHTILIWMIYDS